MPAPHSRFAALVAVVAVLAGGVQTWRLEQAKAAIADKNATLRQAARSLRTAAETIRSMDDAISGNFAWGRRDSAEVASFRRSGRQTRSDRL